mmetsp:Transcript_10298/g.27325  ORF Transcript_10298/g.27325 Transcript_10298/m.27325 type:complete len:206 (+) Transcript_10298:250-867(+)
MVTWRDFGRCWNEGSPARSAWLCTSSIPSLMPLLVGRTHRASAAATPLNLKACRPTMFAGSAQNGLLKICLSGLRMKEDVCLTHSQIRSGGAAPDGLGSFRPCTGCCGGAGRASALAALLLPPRRRPNTPLGPLVVASGCACGDARGFAAAGFAGAAAGFAGAGAAWNVHWASCGTRAGGAAGVGSGGASSSSGGASSCHCSSSP